MDSQDYVIDEKRNLAWGSSSEALKWYRSRVDELEAELLKRPVNVLKKCCERFPKCVCGEGADGL